MENKVEGTVTVNPSGPWKKSRRRARLHHGLFFVRYDPLKGRDWLRSISAEDRQVFATLGREHTPENIHSLGGQARAERARRDKRGRFVKEECNEPQE